MLNIKDQQVNRELVTIDKVFADGSSTVTFCGRNDSILKKALEVLPNDPKQILILGCGPFEIWTTAGQQRVIAGNASIVGVDRSPKITELNQSLKNNGEIITDDIYRIIGNPVFGQEKRPKTSSQLLQEADITGIDIDDTKIQVAEQNRKNVEIAPPTDAIEFVVSQIKNKFSLIFSGNLENNLLFQQGISRDRIIAFHQEIARILDQKGIYVYTTNEVFFNNVTSDSGQNIINTLRDSDLDILYKATQYAHILDRNGKQIVTEDCGIITAKQGEYNFFPNAQTMIEKTRNELGKYSSHFQYIEKEGTIDELKAAMADNQTNISLIKIGNYRYKWFNISGKYENVFPSIAQIGNGFYPDLF